MNPFSRRTRGERRHRREHRPLLGVTSAPPKSGRMGLRTGKPLRPRIAIRSAANGLACRRVRPLAAAGGGLANQSGDSRGARSATGERRAALVRLLTDPFLLVYRRARSATMRRTHLFPLPLAHIFGHTTRSSGPSRLPPQGRAPGHRSPRLGRHAHPRAAGVDSDVTHL